jgi:hypothetical protein
LFKYFLERYFGSNLSVEEVSLYFSKDGKSIRQGGHQRTRIRFQDGSTFDFDTTPGSPSGWFRNMLSGIFSKKNPSSFDLSQAKGHSKAPNALPKGIDHLALLAAARSELQGLVMAARDGRRGIAHADFLGKSLIASEYVVLQ